MAVTVTPLEVSLLVTLAVTGAVAAYRHRQWWYALGAAAVVSIVVVTTLRPVSAARSDEPVVLDLLLAFLALLFLVEATGLPTRVAMRLGGLAMWSREWEFDRKLLKQSKRLDRLIDAFPADGTDVEKERWRALVLDRVPALVRAVRRLRPPDEAWAGLTDDCAAYLEELLAAVAARDDCTAELTERVNRLKESWDALRLQYRRDAEMLLHPPRP